MSSELHILEPWNVLRSDELLSLDVTTGNLRVRVAGTERTYLATAFRFIDVRLPVDTVSVLGMPGGVVTKALDDWPARLGEADDDPATDLHADDVPETQISMAKGNSKSTPENAPSKTGNKSGGGRGNNAPKGK